MLNDFRAIINGIKAEGAVQAEMPEEGGGFIAPLGPAYAYTFMTDMDVSNCSPWFSAPSGPESAWLHLYYTMDKAGREQANLDYKSLGLDSQYKPEAKWFCNLKVADVINISDKGRSNFKSADIWAVARVTTWAAKANRHEYLGICQPLMASAVARMYRPELEIAADVDLDFDVSELMNLGLTVTDDFFEEMFGNPKTKKVISNLSTGNAELLCGLRWANQMLTSSIPKTWKAKTQQTAMCYL